MWGWRNNFWKLLSATMFGWQENFLNQRHSRMAKTVTFWPWWQSFDSFWFETLSFFFVSFIFCHIKKVGIMATCPASWCCWPCSSLYENNLIYKIPDQIDLELVSYAYLPKAIYEQSCKAMLITKYIHWTFEKLWKRNQEKW